MIDLRGKLPVHPTMKYPPRPLEAIKWVVLHHTAGPSTETPEEIAAYHVNVRGWPGIAYHYLVGPDGQQYKCWDATTKTNCVAFGNTVSLCVCLVGNFDLGPVPDAQWNSAVELARLLMDAYEITSVYGHHEAPTSPPQNTNCPGLHFIIDRFRKEVGP